MEKEKWIKEVLESTAEMHKAEPSPFLFEQVTARISSGNYTRSLSSGGSPVLRWGLAFTVSLVITLNVVSIIWNKHEKNNNSVLTESAESNKVLDNSIVYSY